MKHIIKIENFKLSKLNKTYEEVNKSEIKANDYIIFVNDNETYAKINNKIGKVIRVRKFYDEIDIDFEEPIGRIYGLSLSNVKHWSPNKRDLEQLLITQNYNL